MQHSSQFNPEFMKVATMKYIGFEFLDNNSKVWKALTNRLLNLTFIFYSDKIFGHFIKCFLWLLDCEKPFAQYLQAYGFSSVWVLRCKLRCESCLNDFLQVLHSNGFSPVWILWWSLMLWAAMKVFLQILHS